MKLYFDLLTTLKVIHAESPVVIFFGTYGITSQCVIQKNHLLFELLLQLICINYAKMLVSIC